MPEPLRKFLDSSWPTLLKYLFGIGLTIAAFAKAHQVDAFAVSLFEVFAIFVVCNAIAAKSRLAASILSGVLLLLEGIQLLVLTFSNSFLTLIFISNLNSLEDLSGKIVVYLSAVIVMLLFLALPVRHVNIRSPRFLGELGCEAGIIFLAVAFVAVALEAFGYQNSPMLAYGFLFSEHMESERAREEVEGLPNVTTEFYRPGVEDHYQKPASLPDKPNVVIVFTEGLSQNIVEDERSIMPNVARYEDESLSFSSYFNHTFATYRGLIGQFFSGFQHNNFDGNTLVSLPKILEAQGYQTAFINVEPGNRDFYDYLCTLGFQEVLDYPDEPHQGIVPGHLSDRQSYAKLLEEMDRMGSSGQPFLLGIYTVGTHASFDSVDEKFGNGLDTELNKFYDADYQFGQFMQKFTSDASLVENTIIVFTTDHCTYADMYFTQSFPEWKREHMELDPVPLFIYHKGVRPEVIDVKGRNTLGLAPTVCDYLDITCENYFLGNSLFSPIEAASGFETYFSDGTMSSMRSKNSVIEKASGEEGEKLKLGMWDYYAAKHQEPLTPKDVDEETLKALSEKNAGGDVAQTEKTETDVEKAEATKAQAAQPAAADQRK